MAFAAAMDEEGRGVRTRFGVIALTPGHASVALVRQEGSEAWQVGGRGWQGIAEADAARAG